MTENVARAFKEHGFSTALSHKDKAAADFKKRPLFQVACMIMAVAERYLLLMHRQKGQKDWGTCKALVDLKKAKTARSALSRCVRSFNSGYAARNTNPLHSAHRGSFPLKAQRGLKEEIHHVSEKTEPKCVQPEDSGSGCKPEGGQQHR